MDTSSKVPFKRNIIATQQDASKPAIPENTRRIASFSKQKLTSYGNRFPDSAITTHVKGLIGANPKPKESREVSRTAEFLVITDIRHQYLNCGFEEY